MKHITFVPSLIQYANLTIKEFQSRGLFGVRDIHKVILDVGLNKFNSTNEIHAQISNISKQCHLKVRNYIEHEELPSVLPTHLLGKQRLKVREILSSEINLIDQLLQQIEGE